jgi:hypothetical protein
MLRQLTAVGVAHPVIAASAGKAPPAWFGPPLLPSVDRGVFQPVSIAADCRSIPPLFGRLSSVRSPSRPPFTFVGVGHPVHSLPDVRRADARSR